MKLLLNTLILIFVFSIAAVAQTATFRDQAIELYRQKNYSAAAQALQTLTKSNKKDAEIWNMLGLAYLNLSDFKQSRKALEKAVKLQSAGFKLPRESGVRQSGKQQVETRRQRSRHGYPVNPQNAEAYYVKGNINIRQGKFAEAIADADRAIKIKPSFALAVSY